MRPRQGIRFHPPATAPAAEVQWVLRRAFGPPGTTPVGGLDPIAASRAAHALALEARIAARIPAQLLKGELGQEGAEALQAARQRAVRRYLQVLAVTRELDEVAQAVGAQLLFTKGSALLLSGVVTPGARSLGDVDVLVPLGQAQRVHDELIARGLPFFDFIFERGHQLPPLKHPGGLLVEVHRWLRGVRVEGARGSATGEQLLERGWRVPIVGLSPASAIPPLGLVAAHLLLHGVCQHGWFPDTYALTRLLADVQDLGRAGLTFDRFMSEWFGLVVGDLSAEEVRAIFQVVEALGSGADPADIVAGQDGAAAILGHAVAGRLDRSYRESLVFKRILDPLPDGRRSIAVLTELKRILWPTGDALRERLDGRQGPGARFAFRVRRPLHLLGFVVRRGVRRLEGR